MSEGVSEENYQLPIITDRPGDHENASVEPVIITFREQQEVVFSALYHSLLEDTRSEVYKTLTDQAVVKNDVLRGVVKLLAISLGKDKELSPESWLSVGVTDFIPQETLHKWSSLTDAGVDRLFQATARYFERKSTTKG
ncbi:MAG: hypothetical protein K8L97_20450 [Anaerolineae bacterium]|nr:hypothetical protein [Anaerolineae bacterium]